MVDRPILQTVHFTGRRVITRYDGNIRRIFMARKRKLPPGTGVTSERFFAGYCSSFQLWLVPFAYGNRPLLFE